jgi:hypothetical protein
MVVILLAKQEKNFHGNAELRIIPRRGQIFRFPAMLDYKKEVGPAPLQEQDEAPILRFPVPGTRLYMPPASKPG